MDLPDWARAHGAPLFTATIRTHAEDFRVTEDLAIDFSGDGEHDYLWIEKTGANTEWVARQLARHADVPVRDVGYAGLKDRHAVTRQWFSVPAWHAPEWSELEVEGVELLDVARHSRKLRRGAHRANAFRIVLRGEALSRHAQAIEDRLRLIEVRGVPNYFGPQRFGRQGSNVELADAWAAGKRLPRHKRSLAISTARSFLFNEQLDARVRNGTWDRLLDGDTANLDGSGSVFAVGEVDDELLARCAAMDLHPAGELAGEGSSGSHEAWLEALGRARVEPGTRALRLRVAGLSGTTEGDSACLEFTLPRGAFATSVLREIAVTN